MPARLLVFVAIAFGGYFLGGILSNLLAGEGIGRMVGGAPREQLLQLLVAAALLVVGLEVL
jgi:hypothetical protein